MLIIKNSHSCMLNVSYNALTMIGEFAKIRIFNKPYLYKINSID